MKHPRIKGARRQHGLSLIEVLISMVIGLVVVGAVLVSYISSGQTNRLQAAYSQMNEDAQIGLHILSRDLLLAGYAQPTGLDTTTFEFGRTYPGRPVFGCDTGIVYTPGPAWPGTVDCAAGPGTPALEVIYEADLTNTVPTAGNVPSDCLGNQLRPIAGTLVGPPSIDYYHTYNRYYLAVNNLGRSELHCASRTQNAAGNAVPGQPLVDNVEAMRIWYGEANLVNRRQIVRYVTAADVADWGLVVSVRVCLLMRSAEVALTGEDPRNYLDCDSAAQISADGRARRAYFTTTALRNKMAL